jgi:hypothetical protein
MDHVHAVHELHIFVLLNAIRCTNRFEVYVVSSREVNEKKDYQRMRIENLNSK